jgi:predicted O-methyltransferase YrrM
MHPDFERRRAVEEFLSEICPDPFGDVLRRSEAHRVAHGCDLYPAGPHVMRLAATVARACGARRILDLGAGIGYSALWLATAGDDVRIEAIDRHAEHVEIGADVVAAAGLTERISLVHGEVTAVLDDLVGPYDLVHDDAWFASEPPYLERVIQHLRPGGTLTMPNWFLLEDAVTGEPRRDWSEFAGPHWDTSVRDYARRLAEHPGLEVCWSISPPMAIAVKAVGPGAVR